MHPEYPEVEFRWRPHEFTSKNGPMNPLLPDWEVTILEGRIINGERLNADLQDLIHTQEDRLVKHTRPGSDGSTMLGRQHLTTRFKNWNVFYMDHPATEVLWSFYREGHDRYLDLHDLTPSVKPSVQAWANVLRKGDNIGRHSHVSTVDRSAGYISMNYCVNADETTATVYDMPGFEGREEPLTNHPGQLIVFPSWIPHYTTPFEREDSTRITIAADVMLSHWYPLTFENGKRERHLVPFDEHPSEKRRKLGADADWGDVPGVDGTIARLVNYEGELTEDIVVEMKEKGTDYAREALVPEGVKLDSDDAAESGE